MANFGRGGITLGGGGGPKGPPAGDIPTVTERDFEAEVLRPELPVLLEFSAEWCRPCKQIAPEVASFAKEMEGKVIVRKVDIDKSPLLAQQLRIQSVPTFMVFLQGAPGRRRRRRARARRSSARWSSRSCRGPRGRSRPSSSRSSSTRARVVPVDTRDAAAFGRAHLPSAKNMPLEEHRVAPRRAGHVAGAARAVLPRRRQDEGPRGEAGRDGDARRVPRGGPALGGRPKGFQSSAAQWTSRRCRSPPGAKDGSVTTPRSARIAWEPCACSRERRSRRCGSTCRFRACTPWPRTIRTWCRRCSSRRRSVFDKSDVLRFSLCNLAGEGLFTSNGELWRRQRRLMAPLFHAGAVDAYADDMVACADRTIAEWSRRRDAAAARETTRLTMGVAGKTLVRRRHLLRSGRDRPRAHRRARVAGRTLAGVLSLGHVFARRAAAACRTPTGRRARSRGGGALQRPIVALLGRTGRKLRAAIAFLDEPCRSMIDDRRAAPGRAARPLVSPARGARRGRRER